MSATRDLLSLPKAHLHLHLEGAMRPSTLEEMAREDGVEVPPTRGYGSFGAFAEMYVAACELIKSEGRLRRVVREVVEDAAAEGVVWLEPAFYAPRYRNLFGSDRAALEVVADELRFAGAEFGVGTGLVVAADRTVHPAEALEQARLAVALKDHGVVGFGLANDESRWPPEPFAEAFAVAVRGGLLSVPHGGELAGPESVRGCLDSCGAHRVMHGVRAVEDPALVERLAESGTCLDVCPTSNVCLGVVDSLESHPLPSLIRAGVRCSINADDPLLFGPGIADEYRVAREVLGLSDAELAWVARCSLACSGAPPSLVQGATRRIDDWLGSP